MQFIGSTFFCLELPTWRKDSKWKWCGCVTTLNIPNGVSNWDTDVWSNHWAVWPQTWILPPQIHNCYPRERRMRMVIATRIITRRVGRHSSECGYCPHKKRVAGAHNTLCSAVSAQEHILRCPASKYALGRAQWTFDAKCQKCLCVTFDKSNKTHPYANASGCIGQADILLRSTLLLNDGVCPYWTKIYGMLVSLAIRK